MKDTLDAGARSRQSRVVADIAANHFDALGRELRIIATAKTADFVAAGQKSLNYIAAQESAAASDK
jgi:hypothetical protein